MMIQATQISHGGADFRHIETWRRRRGIVLRRRIVAVRTSHCPTICRFSTLASMLFGGRFVVAVVFAGVVESLKDNGAKVVAFGVVPWDNFLRRSGAHRRRISRPSRDRRPERRERRRRQRVATVCGAASRKATAKNITATKEAVTCACNECRTRLGKSAVVPRARRRVQFVACCRSCFQTGCRVSRSASARTCNSTSQPSRRIRKSR